MNYQFVGNNLIKNLIIGAMAIMMIVGLAIPLAVEYSYSYYYDLLTKTFNGFNTLMGNDYLGNYESAVAAVNWILLLVGISCFLLAIYAIFSKSRQSSSKIKNAIAIAALISALLYMIEGIVMTALWYGGDHTTTISPVLFSIQLVLGIIYFVCNQKGNRVESYNKNTTMNTSLNQPQNANSAVSTQQPNTVKSSENQSDKYEELLKYKKLLDIGAITQEEFEAKKKQLL